MTTSGEPRVLIAAPIAGTKQYSINYWLEWIANQDWKNYEVCLCTNGANQEKLYSLLKQIELRDKHGILRRLKILMLPKSEKLTVIQKITYSRERIRRYAVEEKFDYIFFMDTDTIPANKNAIEELTKHGMVVSGLYFYKNSQVPVVIDNETSTNMTIEKLRAAAEKKELIEAWGFGFGCVVIPFEAFSIVPFDYETFGEERTDDFGYCHALEQMGIRRMLYPFVLCKHFSKDNKFEKINELIQIHRKD